ncbi:MAG: hypothetical protein COT37_01345 [Parcubacteria group bacterium CG08_land_8_20_14_0_20_43_9]|nr:MAG: hypothetical protein COT37_01345 [Parcubacteria group bacterium CG08_land_8_20_14_0_20_43_9]
MLTIITILLVSGMAVISFIQIFSSANKGAMIINAVIFLLYCLIGFLLIRYTIRESHKDEILRKKAQEKTGQLKQSRDKLEEQTLEFQKSRDALQTRAAELESWYQMVVQRELEMRNLKKQIKKLQN